MSETLIRRKFASGITRRAAGADGDTPSWSLGVGWDERNIGYISEQAFVSAFSTKSRQGRIERHKQLQAARHALAMAEEALEDAKAYGKELETPDRSDFPKGPKGDVGYDRAVLDARRLSERYQARLRAAYEQRSAARRNVKQLEESVTGGAYRELAHEREILVRTVRAAEQRLELLEAGLALFDADIEEGEVQKPHFNIRYDRENNRPAGDVPLILGAFSGQQSPERFLGRLDGIAKTAIKRVKEALS